MPQSMEETSGVPEKHQQATTFDNLQQSFLTTLSRIHLPVLGQWELSELLCWQQRTTPRWVLLLGVFPLRTRQPPRGLLASLLEPGVVGVVGRDGRPPQE